MAHEAHSTVKRVASKLSTKWGRSCGEVMGWVQSRLSFAILWVMNRCVRGSRVRWRSGFGMEDGAGLAMITHWSGTGHMLVLIFHVILLLLIVLVLWPVHFVFSPLIIY